MNNVSYSINHKFTSGFNKQIMIIFLEQLILMI